MVCACASGAVWLRAFLGRQWSSRHVHAAQEAPRYEVPVRAAPPASFRSVVQTTATAHTSTIDRFSTTGGCSKRPGRDTEGALLLPFPLVAVHDGGTAWVRYVSARASMGVVHEQCVPNNNLHAPLHARHGLDVIRLVFSKPGPIRSLAFFLFLAV